jgi:hypothetical protein
LPYEFEQGDIVFMGRDPIKNQTPDLFSTGKFDGSPSNNPPEALPGRPSRRAALPKDSPKAIRYLEDQELDWLLRTAIHEAKRRGRPMSSLPRNSAIASCKSFSPRSSVTALSIVACHSSRSSARVSGGLAR